MNTVQGIEAIKLYMPPTKERVNVNIQEERGHTAVSVAIKQNDTQPKLLSSVERYRREWHLLLHLSQNQSEKIRNLAFEGSLKVSKFRSIYWAILLRVLPTDPKAWLEQRQQQRARYAKLKNEFIKNPHETTEDNDDPLSQSKKSIWNQYFNDQELVAIIKQDVVRTFPGVDFFRKPHIQKAMCNILFNYAREHPYMNYRQGMHEILAPIFFVMYGDQQSLLHFLEVEKLQINEVSLSETLQTILQVEHLEADTYALFTRLMSLIESYYRVPNLEFLGDSLDSENVKLQKSTEAEVIGQLNSIRDKILAKEDVHLHNYLMKLEIPLHIFGIRWLRLLFGREFPLLDLLMIWDAIFADSDRFELPNYILVAMLIRIRQKLILSDFTTCMTFLMRYPTNLDVNVILQHALHMYMPKQFDMPSNAFTYFLNAQRTTKSIDTTALVKNNWNHADFAALIPTATTSLIKMPNNDQCMQQKYGRNLQRSRATSFDAQETKLKQQKSPLVATTTTIPSKSAQENVDLLRLELSNTNTLVRITHHKLHDYHATLQKHLEPLLRNNQTQVHVAQELRQTLAGIGELCRFLDLKYNCLAQKPQKVDQASEANEKISTSNTIKTSTLSPTRRTILITEHDVINDAATTVYGTAYERPDNGYMRNAKLLDDAKEFEMLQISKAESALDIDEPTNSRHNHINGTLPAANPLQIHFDYD